MKLRLLLFAAVREVIGSSEIDFEVEKGITLSQFIDIISNKYPSIKPLLPNCVAAINHEYIEDLSIVLEEGNISVLNNFDVLFF